MNSSGRHGRWAASGRGSVRHPGQSSPASRSPRARGDALSGACGVAYVLHLRAMLQCVGTIGRLRRTAGRLAPTRSGLIWIAAMGLVAFLPRGATASERTAPVARFVVRSPRALLSDRSRKPPSTPHRAFGLTTFATRLPRLLRAGSRIGRRVGRKRPVGRVSRFSLKRLWNSAEERAFKKLYAIAAKRQLVPLLGETTMLFWIGVAAMCSEMTPSLCCMSMDSGIGHRR